MKRPSLIKKMTSYTPKIGDAVQVRFPPVPGAPPADLGIGIVKEINRTAKKKKKYDVEVQMIQGGRIIRCNPVSLKPAPKEAVKKQRVKTSRRYEDKRHDTLPACSGCHNGDIFNAGGRALRRAGLDSYFNLDAMSIYQHFILVPAKMVFGNVPQDRRDNVTECSRCRRGIMTTLTTTSCDSRINHRALLAKGFVAVICVK